MSVGDFLLEIEVLWPNYSNVGLFHPIKLFAYTIMAMAEFPKGHPHTNRSNVYSIVHLTDGQVHRLRQVMSNLKVQYPPEKWPPQS